MSFIDKPFREYEPGTQPSNDSPNYRSSTLRHPKRNLIKICQSITELSGPKFSSTQFTSTENIAIKDSKEALGQRIIIAGHVRDEDGRPVSHTMIEIWQANAAGRYNHERDQHDAPHDPGFKGAGRLFTDENGGYRFITIKPGAYPWGNHYNAWRPNHIHFSLFGAGYATRLITQMYFPGDPLLALDPIFLATSDEGARKRLISKFDPSVGQPDWALGYRFDIVLRGRIATPMEA